MSKYAIEEVEWSPVTGLGPGSAELAVDPECVVRCVPAAAYADLLAVATELAGFAAWSFNGDSTEFMARSGEASLRATLAKFNGEEPNE